MNNTNNLTVNYPIKYAVLELVERGGYSVRYANNVQGFIASKCYVIESSLLYCSDGSSKTIHKVVFPYEDIDLFKSTLKNNNPYLGTPQIPRINACGEVFQINEVTDLYDTYESAKAAANEKNDKYKRNILMYTTSPCYYKTSDTDFIKHYEDLCDSFNKSIEICNLFEQLGSEETKDMELSEAAENEELYIKKLKPIKI